MVFSNGSLTNIYMYIYIKSQVLLEVIQVILVDMYIMQISSAFVLFVSSNTFFSMWQISFLLKIIQIRKELLFKNKIFKNFHDYFIIQNIVIYISIISLTFFP